MHWRTCEHTKILVLEKPAVLQELGTEGAVCTAGAGPGESTCAAGARCGENAHAQESEVPGHLNQEANPSPPAMCLQCSLLTTRPLSIILVSKGNIVKGHRSIFKEQAKRVNLELSRNKSLTGTNTHLESSQYFKLKI